MRTLAGPVGAALAGGGAGLLLTIGVWEALALAGFVAGLSAREAPGWAAFGAWGVWALVVGTTLSGGGPREVDWAALLTMTLLLAFVAALGGGLAGQRVGERRPFRGAPADGLVGALAGLAVLVLGATALGAAPGAGQRLAGLAYPVFLGWAGAALWAVAALAAGVAALLPALRAWSERRPVRPAAGLGLAGCLVLGAPLAPMLDFFVACTVGTPLPPMRWVTGGASC